MRFSIFADIALTTIAVTLLASAAVVFVAVQEVRRVFGCGNFDPWREV